MASQPEARLRDWSPADAWRGLNKPVFIPAVLIIVIGLIFATIWGSANGADAFETLNATIVDTIGWWYVLIATGFVVFALWAGLSKVGNIRLGRDDEKPEFSLGSWFTMLFAAGMGIGLVFWGVAEPLWHFIAPPDVTGAVGTDAAGEVVTAGDSAAMGTAMGQSIFHWGLHAWAIYVVVGLGLAYMTFRRGRPLSVRWLLEPIFGRKLIESWVGHVIDVVAIVGTVFGIVTSLGIGTQQIAAGLGFMGWIEDPANTVLLTVIIVVIMAIATFSVITGVNKGLKWLSNFNMVMAAILALFVLAAGPTLFLLQAFVGNLGEYLMAFPQLMFETSANYVGGEDAGWSGDWTIYYWGWWMSWSPFVGMFIARISRGRTIRQFVMGVLLAPTLVSILWFTIFGSSGIYYQMTEGVMVQDGNVDTVGATFTLLEQLPLASITAVVAILVIAIFFITSGDSGSLVTDVLSYGGRTDTPKLTRVFWTVFIAITAIVLLAAGGEAADAALRVLQVTSIAAAAPLSIVMVLAVIAQIRMFTYETQTMPRYVRIRPTASKTALVDTARHGVEGDSTREVHRNLRSMVTGQRAALKGFLGSTSATLSGLEKPTSKQADAPEEFSADDMVFAIQDVPAHSTVVNPETGTIGWDEDVAYHDPIADQVFETPEFAESATGQQWESEQIYEEAVGNGETESTPGTTPEENPKR
ncbi:BCCT family transporter [Nesterenkonia jeotgali]|uniref:Choline/glycine/proline betaine transport protein n=1 Tax=Nesterenkonia jeotgali TaxID=317018 RepID=A0A0W8IJ01_9MICC|nr:BCCT family transporter [Nesterenkonia jeotgali]KUG59956.1 transporter [Nesterenkonia jeotgali]MBA8921856.1 choline/glycine/proline betaine transport protein [Nesterenkonia jeotgali]